MANLGNLYLKLPISLQHVTCSLEGWRLKRNRFGSDFQALLREAEGRTFWTAEMLSAYRDLRLRAFVQHCAHTSPYYRQRFKEYGISPEDIRTLDDLKHLPILSKKEIQEHVDEMRSEAVPKRQQIIAHTSGTTGGGLRFATTLSAIQEQWAIWWRYRHWHGIQLDEWCVNFGGRAVVPLSQTSPPFWRYNYPAKQILFSAYHMNSANLRAYVNELHRQRIKWLHGYPSLLSLLAAYILESSAKLEHQVRWITIGSENLLPQQADLIEQAFGVRPRQHYGMTEAVANISECEYGALHVDEDFAAVEFVPSTNGSGCKIVGTNLTNLATPLLRYDMQDFVTPLNTICPCNRHGRIVTDIDGRMEDYVVLKNGTYIGRMDHIFKDMTNIREAQIYQKRPGEMIIRVVRSSYYTDVDEASLLCETQKRVGSDMKILIQYVERVERSRTGKLRLVISEIPEGQLEGVRF